LRHSGTAELAGLVVALPHGEHIGRRIVDAKTFDQMAGELKA
jgi:hypothetical protein